MELSNKVVCSPILQELVNDIEITIVDWNNIRNIKNTINNIIEASLSKFMNLQPNKQQNICKKSTFLSLQNIILTILHKKIFYFINKNNHVEDEEIYKKCYNLSALKITPDQLGASEDYCIPLPAAIVELSSLDMHELPEDKLKCLVTAFDLAMAELKGAMIDIIALNYDNKIPTLSISDITPLLSTVIIHAKPTHLISDLCYIENFYFSNLTKVESECLQAFKTAVDKLKDLSTEILLPRSARIYCDISLEDVIKLNHNIDNMYDREGHRICSPKNPLERHIEQFTHMIAASSLNNIKL